MLPLCEALDINVNELLSGERLADVDHQEKAEETMMELCQERGYTKTYKGLAIWIISFAALSLFFAYKYYVTENAASLVRVMSTAFMIMVDFLFLDIYRGEFVYWITYGPDFDTAREAGTKARKKYAGRYLRTFLIASGIWMIYLICSIVVGFSARTDLLTCSFIAITAGLCTIPIKFAKE